MEDLKNFVYVSLMFFTLVTASITISKVYSLNLQFVIFIITILFILINYIKLKK